jgi:hypothetical protein
METSGIEIGSETPPFVVIDQKHGLKIRLRHAYPFDEGWRCFRSRSRSRSRSRAVWSKYSVKPEPSYYQQILVAIAGSDIRERDRDRERDRLEPERSE